MPGVDVGHSRRPAEDVNVFIGYFGDDNRRWSFSAIFWHFFLFVLLCFNVETSRLERKLSWQALNLKSRSSPVSFKMYEGIQKLYLSSTHTGLAAVQVTELTDWPVGKHSDVWLKVISEFMI